MAENIQDDLLEDESSKKTGKDEPEQTKKAGPSTSLLIKVAVGLGIVLIAMVAAFFLLPPSSQSDGTTSDEAEVSEVDTQEMTSEVAEEEPAAVTPEKGTIELPTLAETAAPAETASAPATENNNAVAAKVTPSPQPASTTNPPSDKVLAEMVALQKQLNAMQQENQKLIKRVEQLVSENQTLKSTAPAAAPSVISPIDDEQLVNHDDVPLYYRQNRYANTPQPDLKPQWGEFQQLN